MECPNKHGQLYKMLFHQVEVDYCPECLGTFFDKDELEYAKDDKDKQLNWMDIDMWRDKKKFKALHIDKKCPACRIPFVEVSYEDIKGSVVRLDFCKRCQGIWLDRGEFKQMMVYLKKKADYEVLHEYTKSLIKELWEVFSGPQKMREELADFFMLLKLLNYKFVTQHPHIEKVIEQLPK